MLEKIEVEENKVENLIYEINGKQVMLDSDLARIYKCKNGTKEINQAVKNNPNKFLKRFSWILSDLESDEFLVKNFDQKIIDRRGGKYKNPRVFTEQGVAMLATILHTSVATEMSIKIMDAFIAMRHYINNNELRLSNVETKVIEHDKNIKLLQESFEKFEEKRIINDIYFNGQIYDAYYAIYEICNKAKEELIIIDSYADNKLLDIIKKIKVNVIIITKENNLLSKQDINVYNEQYNNLKVIYNNTFHDRFFIIDQKQVYHCGTSINRIGYKTFAINIFTDFEATKLLIERINKLL